MDLKREKGGVIPKTSSWNWAKLIGKYRTNNR